LTLAVALVAALTTVVVVSPVAQARGTQARTATATTNPFANIPLTGTTANGGTFKGTLDALRFTTASGKPALSGTLTGTLTDAAGTAQNVTGQAVTIPLQATGTCHILHLTLGPLDLNLLGLTVHLNRVVLDITAQAGPGQLLGNLLCGVAHLLDGNGAVAGLVNVLNSILSLANLANGTPVAGTASNGGTFSGTFTPQRIVAKQRKLSVTGVLTGTVANGGQTQNVTKTVSIPLAAAGTCNILHLTLGPVDLNLLGLTVHLNRVVLDVGAQPGPGNLLGNLLCSIAHLLDRNGPLTGAAAKLNKLLG
jgi:hypothetical protein